MIRAVGFDLDETLAVPERDRTTLLAETIEDVDAPPLTREEYLAAHGRHLTSETRAPIFADLLEDRDGDTDPERVARIYRERVSGALAPAPGAEELVSELRAAGYRVGVLTNGPALAQRDKLRKLGWEDSFDAALVTGELPAGKPDPAAFEALLTALDAEAAETVYVGDDPDADVVGAAAAGLFAVQVLYDGGPDPHPTADAHLDRDRLADLPDVIESLTTADA